MGCRDRPLLTILSRSYRVFISHSCLFFDVLYPLRTITCYFSFQRAAYGYYPVSSGDKSAQCSIFSVIILLDIFTISDTGIRVVAYASFSEHSGSWLASRLFVDTVLNCIRHRFLAEKKQLFTRNCSVRCVVVLIRNIVLGIQLTPRFVYLCEPDTPRGRTDRQKEWSSHINFGHANHLAVISENVVITSRVRVILFVFIKPCYSGLCRKCSLDCILIETSPLNRINPARGESVETSDTRDTSDSRTILL